MAWIGSAGHATKRLIVGSVGYEASDCTISAGVAEDFFENWTNLLEIVVPSEPSTVGSIKIAGNVSELSKLF